MRQGQSVTVHYTLDEEMVIEKHLKEHGLRFSQYAKCCLAQRNGKLTQLYVNLSGGGRGNQRTRSFWLNLAETEQLKRDAIDAGMRITHYVKGRTLYGYKRVISRESARRMAGIEGQRMRLGINLEGVVDILNKVRMVQGAPCVWDGSSVRYMIEWPEDCLTDAEVTAKIAVLDERYRRKWGGGGDGGDGGGAGEAVK